jgi:hypothetical protein
MENELNIPGFKHYELDSTYQAKLAAGEVNAKDLSFVKETGKIYTQGGEYGGGSGDYLEVRELKMNDDMTMTEEQKAYNIETYNKAQAGEVFALSADGFVFNLSTVSTLYVRFSLVGPSPFDNRELLSMNATLFADGTFEPSYLDYCTVDSAMSDSSENAVQNKVVKKYIDDAVAGATPNITVDSALSTTSTNPVQNKLITTKVNDIDTRVQEIESFFEEGAKLNLTIKSNQGSDSSISAVKATVSYDGKSVQLGSGVIGLPVFTDVTITFPEVSGYKVPAPIVFTTGAVPVVYEATYETEIVRVTVNSWNGASVVGQIITINGTQYTWNGSTIQHKVPFGVEYEISCNAKDGFTEPEVVTNIASQVRRDVSLTYTDLIGTWITLNQTITDPATMISGNVNGEDIQLIRNNSHRYLGKYTAEGTMTVCQLDDTDSNLYADRTSAVLTGAEGDVFMKLPKFYYIAKEKATDIWEIGFYYGNSAPTPQWKEWDGNDLIGAYKGVHENGKLYSISDKYATSQMSKNALSSSAQGRGIGFSLTKVKHINIMAILFYAQYGHMNSQAPLELVMDSLRLHLDKLIL